MTKCLALDESPSSLVSWFPYHPKAGKQTAICIAASYRIRTPQVVEGPETHNPGLRGGDSVRKVLALQQRYKFDPQYLFLCVFTCAPHINTHTQQHAHTHAHKCMNIHM